MNGNSLTDIVPFRGQRL